MNGDPSNVGNKHSALMDMCIFSHDSVYMLASRDKTRDEAAQEFEVAFAKGSVHPDLVNLFHASAMMYQQLTYQYQNLENAIEFLDQMPGPMFKALAERFRTCQATILTVQDGAIRGLDEVIASNHYNKG